jgi:exonuclease SbcC
MQIRTVRLKNIKSYGEGPDGNGITVSFEPGVNRVAGRNGHGKTTLIEALGYALFFSEPEHEETFKMQTYFLRSGEKEAEIDVEFTHAGETFRVERVLGASKRRSKVVQLSDGSTCAEMDEPVAAWVCRTMGGEARTVSPRQLSDLFSSLIGVRQGRLTWPFDSKPSAAREFFEPLLDVAIFRDSESRLRDARGRFESLLSAQDVALAEVRTKIEHFASSNETVPIREAEVEARRRAAERSRKQRDEAEKLRQLCEQKQTAFNAAKATLERATSDRKLAIFKREQDERQAAEAEAAGAAVRKAEPGYQAYLKADEQLKLLIGQQSERAVLVKRREEVLRTRTQWEGKRDGNRKQAADLMQQREQDAQRLQALQMNLGEIAKTVEQTTAECERLSQGLASAKRLQEALNGWLNDLPTRDARTETLSDEQVSAWNVAPVLKAWTEERELAESVRQWERTGNKAEDARQTLSQQLAQISGGVCPFLQTKCRQFDPKAVQSDLTKQEKDILEARSHEKRAKEAQKRAAFALAEEIGKLRKAAQDKVEEASKNLEARDRQRISIERDSQNEKRNYQQLETAIKEIVMKIDAAGKEGAHAETQVQTSTKQAEAIDGALQKFANLDEAIRVQGTMKEANAGAHEAYLQKRELAARIDLLQAACKASREAEARVNEDVRQMTERFEQAHREFDVDALRKAADSAADARSRLALDERELEAARNELKREKERLKQWKEACAQRDKIENDTARLRAASDLTSLAAKVLKKAAPSVAQRLCCRIASNAQQIFNQINQEPIEIDWKAEPHYGLRIVPGDRRFSMLSGGEQTKLALAMTLAMIQEFSGLHFAVFDEPTYAVDADSRQKLAEAIIQAQKAARLEQVIVVSHDDAFDGKIEHVVLLEKNAETGTRVREVA